jgi:hypothetical protein
MSLCCYCSQKYKKFNCPVRKGHRELTGGSYYCLNCCEPNTHVLRYCDQLPMFDACFPRVEKIRLYLHTQHWRNSLLSQRKKFEETYSVPDLPKDATEEDATVSFTSTACTPICNREKHYSVAESAIKIV